MTKINNELKLLAGKKALSICFYCCFILLLNSCTIKPETLGPNQLANIKDSVTQMVEQIPKDLSAEGPIAWLKYFEDNPNFFMASEGELIFSNTDSTKTFIKTIFIKKISKIKLQWNNIHIDPLTTRFASIAAMWHEDMTDFDKNTISQGGYFTAIAEKTTQGWKLRNAH